MKTTKNDISHDNQTKEQRETQMQLLTREDLLITQAKLEQRASGELMNI